MLKTSHFNFDLPEELIAQTPFFPKEKTKMLVFDNAKILDSQIINLPNFLQEGDVLVFNDARVIKAKLSAEILRSSAKLEFNLDQGSNDVWSALCKPAKKVRTGDDLRISHDFSAKVLEKTNDGFIKIKFNCKGKELNSKLEIYGNIPLPPYIKRSSDNHSQSLSDKPHNDQKNYQTIYAKNGTAVAAPTAGLHFNKKIFSILESKKIQKAFVTLNVGAGTFLPVRTNYIEEHKMHKESFSISEESANIINLAKKNGKKIIAVGTTSLRALESIADKNNLVKSTKSSTTEIFIFPPYKFKVVDALMTNFHLPKSTLFMLICAFVGKEKAFEIYNHAVSQNYRFYSYGDSSLLFRTLASKY